jgi:hypothetical protein
VIGQENPGCARLIVESGDDRTELDLGADARPFPVEPGQPAPMLSGEELAERAGRSTIRQTAAKQFQTRHMGPNARTACPHRCTQASL